MFYRFVFIQSGAVSAIIGAYFGICLDAVYLGGSPQQINYTKSPLKAVGRFFLVMLFWFLPIYKARDLVRTYDDHTSYIRAQLFGYSIPYFLCSLFIYSGIKPLMKKLKLINI